jgi:hypothetical protein
MQGRSSSQLARRGYNLLIAGSSIANITSCKFLPQSGPIPDARPINSQKSRSTDLMFSLLRTVLLFIAAASTACNSQEREWSWDQTDDDAFLVFGTPNTDDVGVSFWCKLGSGQIKLFAARPADQKITAETGKILVRIAAADFVFAANPTESQDASPSSVETQIDVNHPLFTSLKNADFFTVTLGRHSTSIPLVDANIAALLRNCRTR